MNPNVETETLRRIHFDKHFIEIGEHPDNPAEWIEMRTVGASIEYFGKMNLSLLPEQARALGHALITAANERDRDSK